MNLQCIEEITVRNEHAVQCSIVSKPVCVLEYIKSISALIGASHILAVFEDKDFIKVFFDDKRHVDTLIRSCLHVMGHHITVDYITPPGTKLKLSNVDPIITNYDIMRLLSVYGTVVSPVVCPPICDDIEFCHIAYGVRYVHMNLNGCIPDQLEFKYGDQFCCIKILVVETLDSITFSNKLDESRNHTQTMNDEVESHSSVESDTVVGPSSKSLPAVDISDPPVLVSIESAPSEPKPRVSCVIKNENILPQLASVESTEDKCLSSVKAVSSDKMPLRRKHRKHKKLMASSRSAKRIKNTVKRPYLMRRIKKAKSTPKFSTRSAAFKQGSYYEDADSSLDSSSSGLPGIKEIIENINYVEVLDKDNLDLYLDEVKGHRAPLDLARKYIGEKVCDNDKINNFVVQLEKYRKNLPDINLKSRIFRLIKTINEALAIESSPKEG